MRHLRPPVDADDLLSPAELDRYAWQLGVTDLGVAGQRRLDAAVGGQQVRPQRRRTQCGQGGDETAERGARVHLDLVRMPARRRTHLARVFHANGHASSPAAASDASGRAVTTPRSIT